MRRGQPPKRRTPIPRSRKPIPKRRKDPAKRRFAKLRDPEYCAWIRTLPCEVAGHLSGFIGRHHCAGRIECAHVKAVSTGGDDVGNCIPLCSRAHRWADWSPHRGGIQSFTEQFCLDLPAIAKHYGEMWFALRPASDPGGGASE